jgi:ABC-type multidrug transport system ATPase subunit
MDPEARRHMWDVISHVSEARSVVLTTHSMEECEALCTRVGIMVSGRLQCLGSSQHLKSRFGTGYQVEIRCTEGRTEDTLAFCQREIPVLHMEEHHGTFLRFMAPASLDLAWTFQSLEGNKAPLGISNYSVSQATLEQVFIKFAKEQEEEKGNRLALHGIDENEIE